MAGAWGVKARKVATPDRCGTAPWLRVTRPEGRFARPTPVLCGPVAVICFAEKETKASGEGSEAAPVWSVGTVTAPTRITITNQQLIHSVTDIFTKRLSPLGKCRDPGMWGTQQAF